MEENILKSQAFQELEKITQMIYSQPHKMAEVIDEYEIAKSMGLEDYNCLFCPGPYKLKVITELINNENTNN
ncbi:hypothetical protein [Flavobacterium aestivum]|uniref:hypothetical protein n=1 Tax=Flavobacterium aestivum TaxID=3003257 RepID=UPI00228597A8|nr:hypothetical protein [Flavobacterium aestivum]